MAVQRKTILRILTFALLLFTIVVGALQWKAQDVVKDFLSRKIPDHLKVSYSELNVNVVLGNVDFEQLSLKIFNRDTTLAHTVFKTEKLELQGLDYYQLFFQNTIKLDEFILQAPSLHYYSSKYYPAKTRSDKGFVNLLKTILVARLQVKNGSFHLMEKKEDSVKIAVDSYDFTLLGGKTDPVLVKDKIPLTFDDYALKAKNVFVNLGEFETLKTAIIAVSPSNSEIKDISLTSKYDKEELSKHLTKERDYIQLHIPKVKVDGLDFGFHKDRFGIRVSYGELVDPNLEMYRDKRLHDDFNLKPLYGKLLRDLPLDLDIEKWIITNGYISYEEKVVDGHDAGKLFFEDVNASFNHISNTGGPERTTMINVNTKISGKGKLDFDWSFNINDPSDAFTVSGSLKNLKTEELNSFLEPNLRARAEGTIDEMYFTFGGGPSVAKGDIKMKYRDFKFDVLDKDRLKINKFLTFIGNIFIDDGSKADAQGFRYGTIEAEREINKSFFNYLWAGIREGIISTLTGSGKERE
ncbi:MAG: hypothetical protein WBG90_12440 [Saonia sp.]